MTGPGVTRSGRAASYLLALPANVSVRDLALAWYPQARWTRDPVSAAAATASLKPPRGARFRGVSAVADAEPGELELEPGSVLTGPLPMDAGQRQALGLTAARVDAFEVRVDDSLVDRAARLRRWLTAAARHARGAVLEEGAPLPLDHRRSVNRHLYSAHALPPEVALALVRTVLAQAVLETVSSPPTGPQDFEIVTHTPYDGSVVVRCERPAQLPPALRTLPWRDSGPFRYAVRWLTGDTYPALTGGTTNLHHIARRRMAPVVIEVVAVVRASIAGTVLDDDGFICLDPARSPDE